MSGSESVGTSMTRRSLILTAVALILVITASSHAAVTAEIPLQYDAALLRDGFPSPIVTLTIAGQRASFLVDTGAGVHTFARWFVEAARLPTQPTSRTIVGSTGHENRVDVVADVSGTLSDGHTLRLAQAIVADFPPIFEQHRLGGLLSPQLLAASGEEAVLDLRAPRLTFRPMSPRAGARAAAGSGASPLVCTNRDSPFRNRLYRSRVLVEGLPADLLIDTGATRTVLSTQSSAAKALADRSVPGPETQGVGGPVVRFRRVPSVAMERGGSSTSVAVTLGATSGSCGPDGLLGMDALKGCVLVLGESQFGITCEAH